jgi:hypothetical protein
MLNPMSSVFSLHLNLCSQNSISSSYNPMKPHFTDEEKEKKQFVSDHTALLLFHSTEDLQHDLWVTHSSNSSDG